MKNWSLCVIMKESYQGSFHWERSLKMSDKRKDNKGRVLKTGESQRKDLIYQYRYTDIRGKRQTIYAADLKELREKEKEIQRQTYDGIDYAAGKITVIQLLEKYISMKQGVRYHTKASYIVVMNLIEKEDFGYMKIHNVKMSDAKLWFMKLHNDGRGYSTVANVRSVIKPAFQMAYNEEVIRRNPFDFRLTNVVPNDSQKRVALTAEQQKIWMDFIRNDRTFSKYYDEFVVLLGTGMRVGEFCGLTKSDLDFENRKIRVDHQLVRKNNGEYFIEKTKTACGSHFIPMTTDVYHSLQKIIARSKRLKTEIVIDGYSGFILINRDNKPKAITNIGNAVRNSLIKYRKENPDNPLPHITPHVLRHTFCTNMANAGMDIKTLQYLMGHSDVSVTLNIYTHASYELTAKQMAKIVYFKEFDLQKKQRKSG